MGAKAFALYSNLAPWWPLLSPPEHYAEEAQVIRDLFCEALGRMPADILELGAGGGHVASHLIPDAPMTLVDVAPAMLEVSRQLNPGTEHVEGDMRSVRLGRTFEAVLIHDAIMYMTTEADLVAALTTARLHLRDGGVAVVLPDEVAETFSPDFEADGHDAVDGSGRGLRYMIWSHPVPPGATITVSDYVVATRETDGSVAILHDRHHTGLFARAAWRQAFVQAGFAPPLVRADAWRQDVFVARPASS